MQRPIRGILVLLACLALLLGSTVARARDDKPGGGALDRKALDGKIYTNLKEVINHGADLYNSGDWNGCYRLWEGALMSLKPLLAHRSELQLAIDTSLADARQDPMLYRRAFILRTMLDKIRTELKGSAPSKAKGTDKTPVVTPKSKTLWDRLGGEEGVTRIVDDFFNAAAADPKVDFFRHGKYKPDAVEIAKMKREFVEWVSEKTGGPLKYTGPDMKKVHKDMGITDAQFDATAAHIKKALEKNKVADPDVATVMAAINSYRKEVVAPKKPAEKKPEDKKKEDKKKEENTASVQGKVTYKGQPAAGAKINFVAADGKTVSDTVAADGSYRLAVKPGMYRITISGPPKLALPMKYASADTSGLTLPVIEGKQIHDISLQ